MGRQTTGASIASMINRRRKQIKLGYFVAPRIVEELLLKLAKISLIGCKDAASFIGKRAGQGVT